MGGRDVMNAVGKLRRLDCSKKILIFSYLVLVVLLVIHLTVADTASFATIVCAWIMECGAATGFYFWKAKNENRSKYAIKFIRELAEQYGMDSVARVLETVLKD
jgi:TRAP-type uncharacterized transport system fused permease subunit